MSRSTEHPRHLLHGRRAVVTGADHPTGLGAGRALGALGAEVLGLSSRPSAPACSSRTWREIRAVGNGDRNEEWMKAIISAGQSANPGSTPAFLLPTQDLIVELVSHRRSELEPYFRFKLPPHAVVEDFLDKTRFHRWAAPLGLPLPDTRIALNESDLRAALSDMKYPVVLKPLFRTVSWNRLSPVDKVFRLEAPADVDRIPFSLFEVAPSYILSQWIQGPDSAVHFCLGYCARPGEMTAAFTGRKLLQYPRQTGSTAICVGTDNGELRELTAELFRLANFVGLGSLEVKYDLDGKPYITEPTVGRPNLQSGSAVAAGLNLQGLAMADAMDLDPGPLLASRVRNCWWIQEEAIIELLVTHPQDPVPWRLLVKEFFRARRPGWALWSWRDPAPLLRHAWRQVIRLARRLVRR